MKHGHCLSHISLDKVDSGEELQKTTDCSLMQSFGYFGQVPLGAICLPSTASGEQYISGSFDGEIKAFGKISLKYS